MIYQFFVLYIHFSETWRHYCSSRWSLVCIPCTIPFNWYWYYGY